MYTPTSTTMITIPNNTIVSGKGPGKDLVHKSSVQTVNPDHYFPCTETKYGCCLDGVTSAKGPDYSDCPQYPRKRI